MITSPRNKRVVRAVRLKKRALREKERQFLVEGVQTVREAAISAAAVEDLFYTSGQESRLEELLQGARQAGTRVNAVSEEVMTHLTSTVTPQGVVAVSEFVDVPLEDLPNAPRFVGVLVEVRDPGNAGTILRSADAAGADAIVFTRSSVDVYNEKAVRATAGSLFHLPLVREASVEQAVGWLRDLGCRVLATAADGEASLWQMDLTGPTAALFGNEAQGLPSRVRDLADATVRVPIPGRAESLNLAAAATLVMFESARQRAGNTLAGHGGGVDGR